MHSNAQHALIALYESKIGQSQFSRLSYTKIVHTLIKVQLSVNRKKFFLTQYTFANKFRKLDQS